MPIDFDKELFNLMVEKAVKFWNMVQNKIPPLILPEDDEVLGEIYSEHTDDMIEMLEMNDRVAYLQEIKMHIDELNKEKREIETELKTVIAQKAGLTTDKYKVTWKTQTQTRLDTDRLKEEQPQIIKNYLQEKQFRVLRITKTRRLKMAQNAMVETVNPLSLIQDIDVKAVSETLTKVKTLQSTLKNILVDTHDYGKIPGCGDKPTLLKPGAEKILMALGITSSYELIEHTECFDGKGFFAYTVKCILLKNGAKITEGLGHANSKEKNGL